MMQDGVEFVLKLKDYLSGAMPKVANTATAAFKKVNASAKATQQQFEYTGRSAQTLERYLKLLERRRKISIDDSDINNANRKIQAVEARLRNLRTMGTVQPVTSSLGGGRRMGGFGLGGMTRLAAGIGGIALLGSQLTASANAGLQSGMQEMSYKVLAGDQAGGKLYRDVNDYVKRSIYGSEQFKHAQTQMGFGIAPEKILGNLKMIGDIAMGDTGRFEGLNLAYSQVAAAGKMQGQDYHQFINAGFNPLNVISQQTGRSMSQLMDDMSKGQITFEKVDAAFKAATSSGGKFYKMTEKLAETPSGKKAAFLGEVSDQKRQLGLVLAPVVAKAIDDYGRPMLRFFDSEIMPAVKKGVEGINEFTPVIKDLFGTAYGMVKPVAAFLGSPEFKGFSIEVLRTANSLGKVLIPQIDAAAEGLGALSAILKPLLATVGPIIDRLGGKLKEGQINREHKFNMLYDPGFRNYMAYGVGLPMKDAVPLVRKLIPGLPKGFPYVSARGNEPESLYATAAGGPPKPKGSGGKTVADLFDASGSGSTGGGTMSVGGSKNVTIHAPVTIQRIEINNNGGNIRENAEEIRRIIDSELAAVGYSLGGAINE